MNLKGLKLIKVSLSPFQASSTSAKIFLNRIQTAELATKFATCKIEPNFDSKLPNPSIQLTFSNGSVVEMDTKNMSITDISQRLRKLTQKFEDQE